MDDATRDKLKFQLSVLQDRLAELKERKSEADGKPRISKLDQSLERIRINDPREYVRIMESRDVAEKKLAPKPIGAMDKKDIVLLADLLKGVTAESYGERLGDIERVNPDLLRALKPEYNESSIQTILNLANKEKQQNAADEIKSLNYSIGVLGESPAELNTKVKLKVRLQELLNTKYEDREVATEGTEPAKDALQSSIDSIKWTNKPEVEKAKSALISRIDADVSASKLSTSDAGELKTNLENKVSQIVPKSKKEYDETKEEFKAFLEGNGVHLKAVSSAIALGQAMRPAILDAINNKKPVLDQSNSQKLAALIYQTYNPGTLVSGEMASAVSALKAASADEQGLRRLLFSFGIEDNKVPTGRAIDAYNAGLNQGVEAYSLINPSVSAYKNAMQARHPDSKINLSLTDSYMTGLSKSPSTYKIQGSGKIQQRVLFVFKKGDRRVNQKTGETYIAKTDMTEQDKNIASNWELQK